MIEKPKISVIMPVYNAEKYLIESINSVLAQTFKDFELIVVYDDSEDNSLSILNSISLNDKRIRVIYGENKGLANALNKGIASSKCKYIARMDSDDIALPERLKKQIDYLETNSEVDVLASGLEVFGEITEKEKENYNQLFNVELNSKNLIENFLETCPIPHPSVMFKKDVILKLNGYNETYLCAEDYDLWLRALSKGYRIEKLSEKLIKYRIHKKSKSSFEYGENKMMKYVISARIDYLNSIMNDRKINYLIWGASNGGNFAKKIIDERTNNFNFIGFIDKYKEGTINGDKIYKPMELTEIQFDYIFVATSPGKNEANEYLKSCNFIKVKDYVNLV